MNYIVHKRLEKREWENMISGTGKENQVENSHRL